MFIESRCASRFQPASPGAAGAAATVETRGRLGLIFTNQINHAIPNRRATDVVRENKCRTNRLSPRRRTLTSRCAWSDVRENTVASRAKRCVSSAPSRSPRPAEATVGDKSEKGRVPDNRTMCGYPGTRVQIGAGQVSLRSAAGAPGRRRRAPRVADAACPRRARRSPSGPWFPRHPIGARSFRRA